MEEYYIKFIETAIIIALYVTFRQISFKLVRRHLSKKLIHETRGVAIKKIIGLLLILVAIVFILLIWGVKQSDLALFVGSVITVVGVAFVAQWSLLSNITSSIILFFGHPVKLHDRIFILEGKDYVIEGRVKDIGLFFITLETSEEQEITLPNNIFIAKSIKIIADDRSKKSASEE